MTLFCFTDSGGLQKEAYFFHKPCITLRNETEWVELAEHGFSMLAGADRDAIVSAEKNISIKKTKYDKELFGARDASSKIIQILMRHMF